MKKFSIMLEKGVISQKTFNYVEEIINKLESKGYTKNDELTTHLAIAIERLFKGEVIDPVNDITQKSIDKNPNLEEGKEIFDWLFFNPPVEISKNEKQYLMLHILALILRRR